MFFPRQKHRIKFGFQSSFLWLSRQENLLLESVSLCDSKRELQIFFSIVQHLQFLSNYKGKMAQPVNSQGANNKISFHHGKQFVKLFV